MKCIGNFKECHNYNNDLLSLENNSSWGWIDYIKDNFDTFEKGLSLGSGTGTTESIFIEKGIVKKFQGIDIVTNSNNSLVGDLNFMELPKEEYDLILCKGVLHHLINLEFVIYQINRALKKDGIFIIREYIGEEKQIWEKTKLEFLNRHFSSKYPDEFKNIKFTNWEQTNVVPFEGIRSTEIPLLVNYYFGKNIFFENQWGSITYPVINYLEKMSRHEKKAYNQIEHLVEEIIEESIILDKEDMVKNEFKKCHLFGAYKKSNIESIPKVNKWDTKRLESHLLYNEPFFSRIKNLAKNFIKYTGLHKLSNK